MKKIKRREDFEKEKLRLRLLQLKQEKALHKSWDGLTGSKGGGGDWISGLLHLGSGYLGRMAGRKIENTLNKGIDVMAEKLITKTRR